MTDNDTATMLEPAEHEASLKYLMRLAAPMVITNISFSIMQFVDRFMVSRLGTEALAAILPAGMVSFIPLSFLMGVMTTVNTFVSQSLGRNKKRDCSGYMWQSVYMGLVYVLLSFSIMWPAAPWIFKAMGQPAGVIGMEVTYLRIMLYCQFVMVFTISAVQFFMGIHRPVVTMYTALAGQIVNVAANYVLIFGKLGFPAMGIAGAGWGTLIGLVVATTIRMAVFLGPGVNREFASRRGLRLDMSKMYGLVKIGFPAGIAFTVNIAVWGIVLFGLVGRFGKEPLAASSAAFSCMNVSFMPIVGLSAALTAAVGKAIGQGRKALAARQASLCVRVALVYMGFIGLCFVLFRGPIMKFWAPNDDKVVAAGMQILLCAAAFQLFDALAITYGGALRGAGDTVWLAAVGAFGSLVILGLGGLALVRFIPQVGALGPWIAATLDIMVIGSLHRWRFRSNRWMRIDIFKRRGAEIPPEIEHPVD